MARRAGDRWATRVLDLGTGTAKILMGLKGALQPGTEFWGIDSCEAMLARIPSGHGCKLVKRSS